MASTSFSAAAAVSIGDDGAFNVQLPGNLAHVWIDRDLSWLDFNERVLAEALDERTPLLERAKFLAIFTSNLDEFFMKRVAVLRESNGPGVAHLRPSPARRNAFGRALFPACRKTAFI